MKGFTLIEVMIVVAIIGILVAVVIPKGGEIIRNHEINSRPESGIYCDAEGQKGYYDRSTQNFSDSKGSVYVPEKLFKCS